MRGKIWEKKGRGKREKREDERRKGTQKENMTYFSSNRRMERIISDSQTQTGVRNSSNKDYKMNSRQQVQCDKPITKTIIKTISV